jgi:hypothetical protein
MVEDEIVYSFRRVNNLKAAVHESQRANGGIWTGGLGDFRVGMLACEGAVFWNPFNALALTSNSRLEVRSHTSL